MSDELLAHYNRELDFLRKSGARFAQAHPKIAGRLRLGPDVSEDPHVARMIEAFAYLSARTRLKLDDDYPELTEALLGVLYPHYVAPIPSAAIVQFELDDAQADQAECFAIERGRMLETEPINGEPCRFRTCYDVNIWPLRLKTALLDAHPFQAPLTRYNAEARAVLRLQFVASSKEVPLSALPLQNLRLYLNAQAPYSYQLYELLLNDTLGVAVAGSTTASDPVLLPADVLQPVGFGADEGLLDYPARSFLGYRLLSEFFAFPQKFLFIDINLPAGSLRRIGNTLELFCYLGTEVGQIARTVDANTFRLGCTPMINLFRKRAEPIRMTHKQTEYRVVADAARPLGQEIFSIHRVVGVDKHGRETEYQPFYSFKHGRDAQQQRAYWHFHRRPAEHEAHEADEGTEVFLSLVDLDFDPWQTSQTTLDVEVTCLNRDLPRRLPFGGDQPHLQLVGGAGVSAVRCLTPPTRTLRPPMRHGTLWRLVSHLSLNHLSLVEQDGSADALREILKLYDFADSSDTRTMIDGVLGIESAPSVARVGGASSLSVCRGLDLKLRLDEDKFSGSGVFLFASVLERFFGLYCSINSFTRTILTTTKRNGVVRRWPPRTGERILL